ncbi:CHAT domain-containing tetratricopeptide repeat protein [Microbacterium sp. Marseille-Q6965]|uniref:CHAT domain-containing protein n=1 Tax=Microbacterium sp. Marseille-Q6965 TaxID=2965072 RepID=UPI0021B7C5AF|nr:CHAT domain-containing tetratricopeptide repeat protein [Microbacterium sp. Marseille-Q6965]
MGRTPEELHERGITFINQGRVAEAWRAVSAAYERAESLELEARIAGTLAYILTRSGQPDLALRICQEALEAGRAAGLSDATISVLEGQLGAMAVERGDYAEALARLGRALATQRDPVRRGHMLINKSVALMHRGRLAEARQALDEAARAFGEAGLEQDRARAIHNIGYVALLEGDLITALERMAEARPLAASSPVNAAICDLDRAEVLREAGNIVDAERTLAEVARSFGAARVPQSRAEAELQLARSLVTHDRPRAATTAAAAARRFRALGSTTWAARAEGVRLRALLELGPAARRRAPSAEQVDEAARELERTGFREEALSLRLAWRIARARAGDASGPPLRLRSRDPLTVRLLVHEARAARAAARGRYTEVRRHAAEGLESLARWQRSFGSLDMASSSGMHGAQLIFDGLDAAMRSRRPEIMFDWSERARHFAHQVTPVRPPPDPAHARDLAQLRLLYDEVGEQDAASDPRIRAIRERLQNRQWATVGGPEPIPRADLDQVRAGLDRETAFVTYLFSRGRLACLVVPQERPPRAFEIAWPQVRRELQGLRADLDVSAAIRSGPMARAVAAALDARLATLSRLLVEPALDAAGDPRRVLITAPGSLAGMPWAMLPATRGRAVTLARSASRWLASRGAWASARSVGFAVGPAVARGLEEVERASFAWEVERGPVASGRADPPRVLHGPDARVDAVTGLAHEVEVLHVVAHGRHAPGSPMLSGLSLADGTLFGYDIDLIPDPPATVVLSACELGRSSVRWGSEALSMANAWLHAGAVSVVAAPVMVADDVAAEVLSAFHGGLAAGLAPAEALALAGQETGLASPFLAHGSGFTPA